MEYLLKLQQRRRMCMRGAEESNVQHIPSVPIKDDNDEDDEVGPNGDHTKPTVRTTVPAFVANLEKIKKKAPAAVDDSLEPVTISRGRGVPAARSLRPPSTIGRGRGRRMESIEATTLATASVSSTTGKPRVRAIGLGRGLRVGSSISAPSIPPEPKNIYSNFVFDRHPIEVSNLPITSHRESIISTISNNAVTIIQGSTGCGKSTQVPQFILDDAVKRNVPCNIIVTQPRRIAAVTLADRVSLERDWNTGDLVGYQIGLKRKASDDTRILYVTVGVLLEKIIHSSDLGEWSHIILDEVHERSQDMDLCLLIVKQLFLERRGSTRIVLMSASAQTDKLSDYFSRYEPIYGNDDVWADQNSADDDLHRKFKPPVLTVDGRLFDVELFYFDEIENIFEEENIKYDDTLKIFSASDDLDDIVEWMAKRQEVLKQLLLYFDRLDKEAADKDQTDIERGSVLVFLPGLSQIADVRDYLVGYRAADSIMEGSEDKKNRWNIVPLHSSIPQQDQREVFKAPSSGYRKIILSTNIAESSITVPHVRYVVDFCLTKRLHRIRENIQFSTLKLEMTSKASCEQRKGRAGRLANGRCYRLVSKETFDGMLEFCPAEMQIAPLEHVILRVKLFNRDPVGLLTEALEKPELEDIGQAILTLKEVGALSVMRKTHAMANEDPEDEEFEHRRETHGGCMVENSDHMDGDLTFVGKLMSRLPLDVHVGKLIALGYVFGVLKDAVIIAAGISGSKSIFKQPFHADKPENALEAYRQRLFYSQASYSDCFAIRNAYRRFLVFKTSEFRGHPNHMEDFCNRNYFDKRALVEMFDLIEEIKSRLGDIGIIIPPDELPNIAKPVDDSKMKDFLLQLAIAGAFYPNYFVRKHCSMVETTAQKMFGDRDPKYCVGLGQFPMNKGLLYCNQLEKYYRRLCMKNYDGCRIKIDAHDTKAVVDFSDIQRCEIPSERRKIMTRAAALPVYLALKAKQIPRLRPYLVAVKETNAVHEALVAIQKQSLLKYQTLNNASFENARLLYENHVGYPGLHTRHIKLKVTHASKCCHFFGIYHENENDLRCIEEIISQYVQTKAEKVPNNSIEPNMVCLAPARLPPSLQNENVQSYSYARVSILNRSSNKAEYTWRVKFLDYGGTELRDGNCLLQLPHELRSRKFPYLALECQVAEVQPHSIFRPSGEYLEEDNRLFKNKLFRMKYVNLSIYSLVGSCLRVRLEHSLEFLGPHSIEFKEEDLPSQSDHLERLKARRLSHSNVSDCSEKSPEEMEILKRCHQQKHTEEEERLLRRLSECVINSGQVSRDKIPVTGPEHPYELKFYGMTSYTSSSKVCINQESVNSIIIDDQPQCHLDRLLVSGLVHSSPRDHGQLNLRHTTLLPNLPGLPSLVTMIFAPVAELRVSRCRTRYVGAVCGLGYDESGHPIHPQNDVEVVFDTHFDSRTLVNVNEIRLALNLILSNKKFKDEQLGPYHHSVVSALQERIEDAVKNLFLSGRPVHLVNRVENTQPFLWRLLPSTAFIDNSKEIAKEIDEDSLYQCHFSVAGVDGQGLHEYLRALCVGSSVNEERVIDKRALREFQHRWKEEMTLMLDDIYQEITRMYMNGRGTITGELEKPFICELCPTRPDSSRFGYICPTPMSALTHLFSESHRRSEESIRYQRHEMTMQLNSLISE